MNVKAEFTQETSTTTVLGYLFEERRKNLRKTQKDIAEKLGITSAGWGKIEHGKSSLSVENMFVACEALDIKPIQLMTNLDAFIEILETEGWTIHTKKIENDGLILVREINNSANKYNDITTKGTVHLACACYTGSTGFIIGSLITALAASAHKLTSHYKWWKNLNKK